MPRYGLRSTLSQVCEHPLHLVDVPFQGLDLGQAGTNTRIVNQGELPRVHRRTQEAVGQLVGEGPVHQAHDSVVPGVRRDRRGLRGAEAHEPRESLSSHGHGVDFFRQRGPVCDELGTQSPEQLDLFDTLSAAVPPGIYGEGSKDREHDHEPFGQQAPATRAGAHGDRLRAVHMRVRPSAKTFLCSKRPTPARPQDDGLTVVGASRPRQPPKHPWRPT